MDYHNIFAREQLLKVTKELHKDIESFGLQHRDFGEHDLEFRRGLRDGLRLAVEKIHDRIEALQNEQK